MLVKGCSQKIEDCEILRIKWKSYDGCMWKYFEYVHGIASPQINNSMGFNNVIKVNKKAFVGEYFAASLI